MYSHTNVVIKLILTKNNRILSPILFELYRYYSPDSSVRIGRPATDQPTTLAPASFLTDSLYPSFCLFTVNLGLFFLQDPRAQVSC